MNYHFTDLFPKFCAMYFPTLIVYIKIIFNIKQIFLKKLVFNIGWRKIDLYISWLKNTQSSIIEYKYFILNIIEFD